MDMFKVVEFDVRGTEPKNRILDEDIVIVDKTCPWVIPDGSPFFTEPELWTIYDERGALLTLGKDYWLEEEFIPFCDMSGRSICCFVRLSDQVREENKKIKATYQSIGAWFVPRNNLEQWLELITSGKPVPWEKVFGVPATLPSEFHSHSVLSEIGDWHELSFFFNYMSNIYRTRDVSIYDDIDKVINESFAKLTEVKNAQLGRIVAHDSNYNVPHGTNKSHLLLGNLDNFDTATPAQDLAGTAANLFSTPRGAQDAAKARMPNTDGSMYAGVLPISQFGNNTFIPPNISGSFEGMGQQIECSGLCLEPGGTLMMLSNHFDGRTSGLYFSTVDEYKTPTPKITYTNYKYSPPVLESQGIEVNRIISGSGNKVIMVGQFLTDNWFIALTNNTFDPASHSFVRCNMKALTDVSGSPWASVSPYGPQDRAIIHHMGKYLVLAQHANEAYGVATTRFYRVLTEDVRAGRNVTWEALPVTYTDWEGTQFTNALVFRGQKVTLNAQGKIIRFGRLVPQQPFDAAVLVRRDWNASCPQTSGNGIHHYHILQYYHCQYFDNTVTPPISKIQAMFNELIYLFNPETGLMSLQSKSPETTLNFLGTWDPADHNKYATLGNFLLAYTSPASVVLANGYIVGAGVIEGQAEFPTRLILANYKGVTSAEQLLSRTFSSDLVTIDRAVTITPTIKVPTKNGVYPASLTFESDGELFEGADLDDPNLKRKTYFRKVTGSYALRESVKNINLGTNIYSRPLTNEVYLTNLYRNDPPIGITGSNAELAAGGVEMGTGSLSSCAFSWAYGLTDWLPENPALRAPASGNVKMSFPRTYSKVLDAGKREATYSATSFFGFRQNVIDQLLAYTGGARRWGVSITHLGEENGGMFRGLGISVIAIDWIIESTLRYRTQMLVVRPEIEAPNADHPGVHLIKSYTVLHNPGSVSMGPSIVFEDYWQFMKPDLKWITKGYFSAYRDGTNLKVLYPHPYTVTPYASENIPISILDLNISTNQIVNLAVGWLQRNQGDIAVMWPGVGMTDVGLVSNNPENTSVTQTNGSPYQNTGGAANIFIKTGVGYILPSSVYPETGWILFIQENIQMMISGTLYTMQGGTLDLRDIDPNPANKKFYMYATVENGEPKYIVTTTRLRRRANLLPAATFLTNDRQILTITRLQPFMVGDYMLSDVREGGTIPVSAGFPQDQGNFLFLKRAELLP